MRPEGPSPGTKVLLAMSGGVDSSLAAALLLERGYDVVGVFMRLGSPGESVGELIEAGACDPRKIRIGKQGCCSVGDAGDARLVAAQLGIPFYVCNFRDDFGRIIDYFVDEYAQGRTPNPCVRCNDWLKFGKLHEYAQQIGAEVVASGHYARVADGQLRRGCDASKDQSYVLFGAPRARLGSMLLPIGDLLKTETRAMAEARGLPVFDKPDSQEICFVPDNDYAGLLERRRPELAATGAILSVEGEVLGEHQGAHRFTIGQRRGLGIAAERPLYVIDKDTQANTVTVGSADALLCAGALVAESNWLVDPSGFADWAPCWAQLRYTSPATPARVRVIPDLEAPTPSGRTGAFEVRFGHPQRAVAPGQAAVLYSHSDPDLVLGGGWIVRSTPARARESADVSAHE
ncbi:MAG: tRNA 2-thiouridine(34) synthase MnmA [Phycisphaerales bacterium JB059]